MALPAQERTEMQTVVSMRAFAKIVGCDPKTIRNAVKDGRLVRSLVLGNDGEVTGILQDIGVEEWGANSPGVVSPRTRALNDDDLPLPANLDYGSARAVRETYLARLAKLQYEERMGRLVDSITVEEQAFELGRRLQQAILAVPLRFGHELAAESDVNRLTDKLTKALKDALEQVANDRSLDRRTTDPAA